MRSCGPARSRSAASTLVPSSDRIPSTPSGPSASVNVSRSAASTRAGTGPVTCTVGRTLRGERDAELAEPRMRGRARDEKYPGVVLARAEGRVRSEQREAQLAARPVRVRHRRDTVVQRERDPRAVPQMREVTHQRRGDERRPVRQRAQQLAAGHVDDGLLVELLGDLQPRHGTADQPSKPPRPCEARAPRAAAEERDLPRERALALRKRGRIGGGDLPYLDERLVRLLVQRRATRRPPRKVYTEDVGDRRQDVLRRDVRVDDASPVLTGKLHEERDEGEVGEVRSRRLATLVAAAEADSVVRIDQHERLAPKAHGLQPVDEAAEQLVRVADLEQLPLIRLQCEVRAPPELVAASRRARVRDRPYPAVREVEPRPVRHQEVQEIERRLRGARGAERGDEAIELLDAPDIE